VVAPAMIRGRYRNTLAALAVLAVLAGTVAYLERRKGREGDDDSKREKILRVESKQIRSITLRPQQGETIVCRREGEEWKITSPRELHADSSAVDGLLNSLTDLTADESIEPAPENLASFGLEPPKIIVEAETEAEPAKFTLLLGDETPTGAGVYARVEGQPRLVILPRYLKTSFEKTVFDLRDRRATTLDMDQLLRIEVERSGKRWMLVKNPEGVWNLDLPPPVRADRFTASGIVNSLRNAVMQSVEAEEKSNLARYGLNRPELRVRLVGPAGSQTLLIGKPQQDTRLFAINSELAPVFTVWDTFVNQFRREPDDLRDKELFAFAPFDTKRLEVETETGTRVFERQPENKWKQTAPEEKDVDAEKLEELLRKLRDVRAESFPSGRELEAFGLSKPAYRFRVRFGEKDETQTVEVGRAGDRVYARRSTDVLASEVSKTALEGIEAALKEL
jgi:hypothetical protein